MCRACRGYDEKVFETEDFKSAKCICIQEEEYCHFGRIAPDITMQGWVRIPAWDWNIRGGKVVCSEDCGDDCEIDISVFPKWAIDELAKLGITPSNQISSSNKPKNMPDAPTITNENFDEEMKKLKGLLDEEMKKLKARLEEKNKEGVK